MRNDKLSIQSMNFAVSIINLVKFLKENNEKQYKESDTVCAGLRAMLIASINTAKENIQ